MLSTLWGIVTMKCFILLLSVLIITEASRRNEPGIEIYELIKNQNGIKIRPISSNYNPVHKKPRAKPLDSSDRFAVEVMKQLMNQFSQYESDDAHIQADIPLEENLFFDQTRAVPPQDGILLHVLTPKQTLSKQSIFPENHYKPILRAVPVHDRTLPPRTRHRYEDDE